MSERHSRLARRSFLAKAGVGGAAIGAAFGATPGLAAAQSAAPAGGRWQPARHSEDEWLDRIPGKHRLVFDCPTIEGLGQAIRFADNYYTGNKSGYGIEPADVAVVITMRHDSTAFAYTDAMWRKYTKGFAERLAFNDPKTGQPPTVNLYRATLDSLIKNGAHFAVCQLATRRIAGIIARQADAKVDDVYQELVSNLIPNAHMVPAGIVAVSRAQERGYSFAYAG